jgi:hypothetical protein
LIWFFKQNGNLFIEILSIYQSFHVLDAFIRLVYSIVFPDVFLSKGKFGALQHLQYLGQVFRQQILEWGTIALENLLSILQDFLN